MLQRLSELFATDIENMPHEMLAAHPGGKARCGYDLIMEVATINRMVAAKCSDPGLEIPTPQGWTTAPDSYKNKEAALADFKSSVSDVCAALAELSPDKYDTVVMTPLGEMPLIRFGQILPVHTMYHSGQLNYIQTLHGDDAFHWA
ncbi:MAG: hypothetical protein BGO01_13100 [Armatimonadetes bacterium 55-13]|nr:MAG: hypothetical protein ABT09_01350 [bacterium SCN 57-13]OJU61847.1 MAG: hypothetical protein BGO01_13100 [Armatimonadetes bacterium 55-13]